MKIVLIIFIVLIIGIDIVNFTPWGVIWNLKKYDECKPMFGFIFVFLTSLPLLISVEILKYFY